MTITPTLQNVVNYRRADFHVLKIGDFFFYKGKKYQKTNDDGGILLKTKKFRHFWPQESLLMDNIYTLNQMLEKYPDLAYSY